MVLIVRRACVIAKQVGKRLPPCKLNSGASQAGLAVGRIGGDMVAGTRWCCSRAALAGVQRLWLTRLSAIGLRNVAGCSRCCVSQRTSSALLSCKRSAWSAYHSSQ